MKDLWLKAAYRDEKVVADFLLRLRQSSNSASSSSSKLQFQGPILPAWGKKQLRSTPLRKYGAGCSPRTPLSWSGTASPSYDEATVDCAPLDPVCGSRSKNFPHQLKEEETELLKERVNLKRELDCVHVNLKEHRNRSDNLKRIKFDLNQQSPGGVLSTEPEARFANHRSQMETSRAKFHRSIFPRQPVEQDRALANSCGMQEVAETNKGGFILPDLNMPMGEDEIAAELW